MTARFVVDSVRLLILAHQFLFHGPWPRPCRRVVDDHGVFDRCRIDPSPALHEMQFFARAPVAELWRKIGNVDNQRVAFPVSARITETLWDRRRQMRTRGHWDHALPALSLACVVEDGYGTWRLHDSAVPAKVGKHSAHASLCQVAVFRFGIQIEPSRVV